MFIPAGIAGILLGVFLWIVAMIILRTFGLVKKSILRFIQSEGSEDLEMGGQCNNPDADKNTFQHKKIQYVSEKNRDLTSDYITHIPPCEKSSFQKSPSGKSREVKSGLSQSTQSSPVSLSSGIGASERESADDRDSLSSCKDFHSFTRERGGGDQTVRAQDNEQLQTASKDLKNSSISIIEESLKSYQKDNR